MSKDFPRHSAYKFKRLSSSWRKQRGSDNKVRKELKGYLKKVKIGYGTSKTKPKQVVVANSEQLKSVPKDAIILFSSKISKKKKLLLLKIAEELKLTIANVKPDFVKAVEDELKTRKVSKDKRRKKKEEKQKELDKKSKDKKKEQPLEEKISDKEKNVSEKISDKEKNEEENISDKEKKDYEKKKQDKLLTRKEGI